MKLERWAHVAEVSSGIAVVITLVILVLGIRENTETTRASMFAGGIESINATERSIMEDPELSQIFWKFLRRETSDLTDVEQDRLGLMIASLFRTFDTAFSMQRYELFGENEWTRFQRSICAN